MNLKRALAGYVEHLATALGHADWRGPLVHYCRGLLVPGGSGWRRFHRHAVLCIGA